MKNMFTAVAAKRLMLAAGLCGLMLITSTCKKNAAKADAGYVGEWSEGKPTAQGSCFLHVVISSKGDGSTESWGNESDCKHDQTTHGKAKTNGKTLKIGLRSFSIKEKPTLIDTLQVIVGFREFKSAMRMQLDDHILYKLITE